MFIITINTLLLLIAIFVTMFVLVQINSRARYEYAHNDFEVGKPPWHSLEEENPKPPNYKSGWELVGITCFNNVIHCAWRRRL